MKCRNCGAEIAHFKGETVVCDYCHSTFHRSEFDSTHRAGEANEPQVIKEIHHYHDKAPDKLSAGLGCLCFFFFPLAWIVYFMYKDSSPAKARTALIIAVVMTFFMLIGIAGGTRSGP